MTTSKWRRTGWMMGWIGILAGVSSLGAAPFRIRTVAGTGTGIYNGDDQPATLANLSSPLGVYRNAAGDLFIAEFYVGRVRRVDGATGEITTIAGTGTPGYNGDGIDATTAQLAGAAAVAEDAAGNLHIVDTDNSRIRRIDAVTGLISTVAGTGTGGYNGDGIAATSAQLWGTFDIVFDPAGNFYLADRNSHRVRRVDAVTGLISTVVGTGTGGYNGDGIAATSAQLHDPVNLAMDGAGNLFIAERYRVRRVDALTGLISTVAGTGTAGYNGDGIAATSAQVNFPMGITFDTAGDLYIADRGNARIRKVDSSTGQIATIAGTGTSGFNGDHQPAVEADLAGPNDVIVDADGSFYLADSTNNRVRKVSAFQPDGSIGATPDAASALGDDIYNESGAGQTLVRSSTKARTVSATVFLENDSAVDDIGQLRGGLGSRRFAVTYFSRMGNNITAAVGAGTFRTGEGSPGDRDHVTLMVKPNRTLLRKTLVRNGKRVTLWRSGNVVVPLVVSSVGDPGLSDTALFIVKHH